MMNEIAILRFRWEGVSPLHSGYSRFFAEFAKEARGEKKSFNLETRGSNGELSPSFLVSSVKGVFRSASAWLVERIAREEPGKADFITCDYIGDEAWKKAPHPRRIECPICRVYGGSGCRVHERYRIRSNVTFAFRGEANKLTDAIHPRMEEKGYPFAYQQISRGEGKLNVQTLNVQRGAFLLELQLDDANDFAMGLVCLTADLISSGFFRFGRFTSRGYGVVRLIPEEYFQGGLNDLLLSNDVNYQPAKVDCGYELAKVLLEEDPIKVVKRVVRNYIK